MRHLHVTVFAMVACTHVGLAHCRSPEAEAGEHITFPEQVEFLDVSFIYDGGTIIFAVGAQEDHEERRYIAVVHPDSPLREGLSAGDATHPLVLYADTDQLADASRLTREHLVLFVSRFPKRDAVDGEPLDAGCVSYFRRLLESTRGPIYWGRQAVRRIKSGNGDDCYAGPIIERVDVATLRVSPAVDDDALSSHVVVLLHNLFQKARQESSEPVETSESMARMSVSRNQVLGQIKKPGGFLVIVGPKTSNFEFWDLEGGESGVKAVESALERETPSVQLPVGVITNLPIRSPTDKGPAPAVTRDPER